MPPLDHVKNDNDVLHVPVGEWITGKPHAIVQLYKCKRKAVNLAAAADD